jgi:hypothetical protein
MIAEGSSSASFQVVMLTGVPDCLAKYTTYVYQYHAITGAVSTLPLYSTKDAVACILANKWGSSLTTSGAVVCSTGVTTPAVCDWTSVVCADRINPSQLILSGLGIFGSIPYEISKTDDI